MAKTIFNRCKHSCRPVYLQQNLKHSVDSASSIFIACPARSRLVYKNFVQLLLRHTFSHVTCEFQRVSLVGVPEQEDRAEID